jgi:hypothetical protein
MGIEGLGFFMGEVQDFFAGCINRNSLEGGCSDQQRQGHGAAA